MRVRLGQLAALAAVPLGVQVVPAATWLEKPTMAVLPSLRGIGLRDHVAITFDDGPDPVSTPLFIEELDRLGWSATFFLLGSMAKSHPGVARQIVAAGHEIGIHGYRHRYHLLMTPSQVHGDLVRACDTIIEITGVAPRWVRAPYGVMSIGTVIAAVRLGLRPVLWSAWGKDWKAGATAESITSTVLTGLEPGGTILLHDSDCTSTPGSWKATLASLPLLAEHLEPLVTVGPLRDHFGERGAARTHLTRSSANIPFTR